MRFQIYQYSFISLQMPTRKALFFTVSVSNMLPLYCCLRKLWASEMVVGTYKWIKIRIQHVRLSDYLSKVTRFTCCNLRALLTQRIKFYLPTLKSGKHLLKATSILFLPNKRCVFIYTTDILGGKRWLPKRDNPQFTDKIVLFAFGTSLNYHCKRVEE